MCVSIAVGLRRPSRRLGPAVLTGIAVLAWAVELRAAEWSAEPSVSLRADYNSNLTLTVFPHDEVWGYWASPAVTFAGSTESLRVSAKAAADFVRYVGGEDVSFTNLYFPLSARYRREQDTWSLEGGLTRDNTLLGELQQTGVRVSFTQRNLWTANPSWTRALTEKLSVQGGYQFADASYDNGFRLGLIDYQVHGGNGAVLYDLTERDQVQFTGHYVTFSAPDARLRSAYYGATASMTHSFSESATGTVSGGPRQVSTSQFGLKDSELVWLFAANLRAQGERSSLQLDVSRDINPSGLGLLIRTDRAAVTVSNDVTETLTASISGQVLLASGIATKGFTVGFPDQRYVSATPKITWRMTDWWTLTVSYTYAQLDIDNPSRTAGANSTFVMVTYTMPKLAVSR